MSRRGNATIAEKTALSASSAAQVKAVEDPLAAIHAATANLPDAIRAAILALVTACQQASGKAEKRQKA